MRINSTYQNLTNSKRANTNFNARFNLQQIRCCMNSAQRNRLESAARSLGNSDDSVHVMINSFTDFNAQAPQYTTWVRCIANNKVVDDDSCSAALEYSRSLGEAVNDAENKIFKYFRRAQKG